MKSRFIMAFLTLAMLASLSACSNPHEDGSCSCQITGTAEIFTADGMSMSYEAFGAQDSARNKYHRYAVTVTDKSFPIRVILHSNYSTNAVEQTFESYGAHFASFIEAQVNKGDSFNVVETLPREYNNYWKICVCFDFIPYSENENSNDGCPES